MEEQIKRVAAFTRNVYIIFWLVPVLAVIMGETGEGWNGIYADDVRVVYLAEAAVILLTACCVPVSLKLFAWVLARKIDRQTLPVALKQYALWSTVRLILLEVPALTGCVSYYLMMSNKCILCALIALTASLFCLPGEVRLRRELKIESEE